MDETRVILALGTNLGRRLANLRRAIHAVSVYAPVVSASPVYETAPWGILDQPAFLNQVVAATTRLDPHELLAAIKQTERDMGRRPVERNGPRLIDIDILFYGGEQIDGPDLQIPHPRLRGRSFILPALADLAPDLKHPGLGMTAQELADEAGREGVMPYRPVIFGRRTLRMGVINLTPDSFSGDGLLALPDPNAAALDQARRFIAGGADILDLGGESTRPGAPVIDRDEELARVLPAVTELAEGDALVSVDTYKSEVAEAALLEGADWINDVWGLRADSRMAAVIARYGATCVLMHNRSKPADVRLVDRLGGRYVGSQYSELVGEVKAELLASVDLALQAGIPAGRILIDPGIGFGKTVDQNLELLDRLGEIRALGYPLVLGVSRKSFIGYTLDLPPGDRLEGTAAAVAIGIARGADVVRVHDLPFMTRVARMSDAIVRRVVK